MITENLEQVRKNIEEACRAVNRDPGEVTLISVSKTKPVSMLQEAYDAAYKYKGPDDDCSICRRSGGESWDFPPIEEIKC